MNKIQLFVIVACYGITLLACVGLKKSPKSRIWMCMLLVLAMRNVMSNSYIANTYIAIAG